MDKGGRRGVVVLKGAHLDINAEDDSTFTIRSDGKTFHFQGGVLPRDVEERQKWLCNLEDAISFHIVTTDKYTSLNTTLFQSKILEADGILQLLIEQVEKLEQINNQRRNNGKQGCYECIIISSRRLIEAVKYSIVSIQLAKIRMDLKTDTTTETLPSPVNDDKNVTSNDTHNETPLSNTEKTDPVETKDKDIQDDIPLESLNIQTSVDNVPSPCSGSDDDDDDNDFFDADDTLETSTFPEPSANEPEVNNDHHEETSNSNTSEITFEQYEAAYEESPEEDVAHMDGTIIRHIISQCSLSMDLTKITLPTFILERRSFLEMLADFLAHPDEFVNITNYETPRERFIQVVKWYLSAFHAGRRSPVPKKPYNPILGEIFQCSYEFGSSSSETTLAKDGPVPWASDDNVTFIAEQTSHHPPIASFYAECPAKRIQIDGCLWTKSQFLGLSIGVHMIGDATVTLLDYDESYVMTFPSAYGRSILLVPWKHKITGTLFGPDKKEFCKLDGEWNGVMTAKYSDTKVSEVFFDTKITPVVKKYLRPIARQDEHESRRMWKDVTYYLKNKQMEKATAAKSFLEQRQRNDAKERAAQSLKWQTKHFTQSGEHKWTYENKLSKRIQSQS
ncbi:hypothetical protein I4U23_001948 [Adineta vaga]|nr:hypothetical protein I4U23_001948 [Adineta vaga]